MHTPEPRYTIQEAADELGMGPRALFSALRRRRVLDDNNVPRPRYKDAGYLIEQEQTFKHPVVGPRVYSRAMVTGRGLAWLRTVLVEGGPDHSGVDALLHELANLDPDADQADAGKLNHIVSQARAILAARGGAS